MFFPYGRSTPGQALLNGRGTINNHYRKSASEGQARGGVFPRIAMKTAPRTGMTGEERIVVGPQNRISFADERMPAVLATPWLVAQLEYAARNAIAPCLEENERSVGTYIEVEHLAPVPEGFTVVCKARVIRVDGVAVTFQVEAHDGTEVVAKGLHRRRVIDADRFARRVAKKRGG
jgi:predicted thioesterase